MNRKYGVCRRLSKIVLIGLVLLCLGSAQDQEDAVKKEVQDMIQKAKTLANEGKKAESLQLLKNAVRKDVKSMIRQAKTLAKEGKYAEALRILFDAMDKEERMRMFLLWNSEEALHKNPEDLFPFTVYGEITNLEESLIHEDPSPLMQWFRDPDVPFPEKRACFDELRDLAAKPLQDDEKVLFRGQYQGTLVRLMTSRLLTQPEKFDVLGWIHRTIQNTYSVSSLEQEQQDRLREEQIREEITQLQTLAEHQLNNQQYIEAFLLFSEARQKLWENLDDARNCSLCQQVEHSINNSLSRFVLMDEGPLMQVLKDPATSVFDKRDILDAVQELGYESHPQLTETIRIGENEYEGGTLVHILSNPKIDEQTRISLVYRVRVKIFMDDVARLPTIADQKLGDRQYVEAFLLLSEATLAYQEATYEDYGTVRGYLLDAAGKQSFLSIWDEPSAAPLWKQIIRSITELLHADASPLMRRLRNPETPVSEKEAVLAELGDLYAPCWSYRVEDKRDVQGTDDPLIHILSHPDILCTIKDFILKKMTEMMGSPDSPNP